MAATFLGQIEREYFSRKLGGVNDGKELNQIKREYFAKFLAGGTPNTPFNQLEKNWMRKVIIDAAGTPAYFDSDLWKQMVVSLSLSPQKFIEDNKITFYRNAA